MEAIRTGDSGQVEDLIGMIRTTTSNEEVSNYLATNFPHVDEDESRSKSSTRQQSPQSSASRFSRTTLGLSTPMFKVPAKPWTAVTDDDWLVSHLVSLWFTWRHWCYPFIDRDIFIAAMQSGEENGGVCTATLVNMILADACVSGKPNHVHVITDEEHPSSTTTFPTRTIPPRRSRSPCRICFTRKPRDMQRRPLRRGRYRPYSSWPSNGCCKLRCLSLPRLQSVWPLIEI